MVSSKIKSVIIADKNIVKIISAGVLLWGNNKEIKEYLEKAADNLQIRCAYDYAEKFRMDEVAEVKYENGKFKDLPTSINGFNVKVRYSPVTERYSGRGRWYIQEVVATIYIDGSTQRAMRKFVTMYS